ncbi:MAG: hypothetical protein HYT11_02160 [Candidatus Levybacteria bacterium]|nr:hypothetical protein [Candidatus Levybacteria bacterium]
MATRMNVSGNYGTHLPCLIKAMERTSGDVLELGMGLFSTPYLHYQCMLSNRKLISYENFKSYAQFFIDYGYPNANHEINIIDDYANAKIDRPWDVVLIDQTPDTSRIIEVRRLANLAKYIIIHDSNEKQERIYHYSEIYPLFKYRTIWDKDRNHATVLSNFVDLEDFWK